MSSDKTPRRALLSVSDKTGLVELGRALAARGVEILSTGGTARALGEAGIAVVEVSEHTGFPEIMDGRVKTLQPKIHGGILARRGDPDHLAAMAAHDIAAIDLVVVNLYPFEATVAAGAGYEDCVENIDIGGPALIRAAAKNHAFVTVVVDPADYPRLIDEMKTGKCATTPEFRAQLAARAFGRTGVYDAAISGWFSAELNEPFRPVSPSAANVGRSCVTAKPAPGAAFYATGENRPGVTTAEQVQGKDCRSTT